jgi:hypothetical protein
MTEENKEKIFNKVMMVVMPITFCWIIILFITSFYFPVRMFITGKVIEENVKDIKPGFTSVTAGMGVVITKQITIVETEQKTKILIDEVNDTTFIIGQKIYILKSPRFKNGIFVTTKNPSLFTVFYYSEGINGIIKSVIFMIIQLIFLFVVSIGIIWVYVGLGKGKLNEIKANIIDRSPYALNSAFRINTYIKQFTPVIINFILLITLIYFIIIGSFSVEATDKYLSSAIIFIGIITLFVAPSIHGYIKNVLAEQNFVSVIANSFINSCISIYTLYKLLKFLIEKDLSEFASVLDLIKEFVKSLV